MDVSEYKKRISESEGLISKWRKEAVECYEFIAGHQISDEDRQILEEQMRPAVVFNRIDPVVSTVSGYQISNQQMIRYFPRTEGDAKPNEIYTEAARWIDDESDAQDEVSEAFWDLLVCGMGWTETRMSYDEDPEGKVIGAERVPPLEMGWDIHARKRNLTDSRFFYRAKWWNRDEAEKQWPRLKNVDYAEAIDSEGVFLDDEGDDYSNSVLNWYDRDENRVQVVQYQWSELRPVYLVGDPVTGRIVEFDEKRYNRLKDRIEASGLRVVRQNRKKYFQAFVVGETVLEEIEIPGFTLLPMTGKRDEYRRTWYGLVRAMIDPQRWSNKFLSEIEDIVMSNRQGGAFVEETALVDPRRAEDQWNDPNALIIVRDGALSRGAIMERNPSPYPAGMDRIMQVAIQAIPQVTGINPELMGLVDREQPGVLEAQRKRAGMNILTTMFNSLRRHTKARGRLLLHFINEYISDGRLIRITTDEGEKYVPLEKNDETVKYDVIVGESPTSPNQKEETFAILSALIPQLLKIGVPVPPEILDYMPLPADLIDKWKQMIKPDPQKQQMQQMAQQLEMAAQQAKVEREQAAAEKDQATAMLNQVKAIVEALDAKLKPYQMLIGGKNG